jgi:hypothetical protein
MAVTTVGLVSVPAGAATANDCVAPGPQTVSVKHVHGHPDTYTASLKQSTVTCSDWTVNVSSYTIPNTWDHNGWNPTILPQHEYAHVVLTFPAGRQDPITVTVPVPTCGSYQTDAYTGPELKVLNWPAPMQGVKLDGTIHAVPVSDNCTPPPPPPSPPPTVPPVVHPKGHAKCDCRHHRDVVHFVMNNRHSKNGSRHHAATVHYRWQLSKRTWARSGTRNVLAGHKFVTGWKRVPRGTHFKLWANGHLLDKGKVNKLCRHHHHTPPPGPPSGPPTGL